MSISSMSSIALGGLNQAQTSLDNTARRIAGAAGQSDSVDLSTDAVALIQAKNDFGANIMLKVADEMDKSAIDLSAEFIGGAGGRKDRSTVSFGSVDTGPSRQIQSIISRKIAQPNFWPCRFMPHA